MTVGRAPQIGDLFAVHRSTGADELYGRVVSTDAIVGPSHGCNLVYIYRPGSRRSRDALLIPPLMTTRAPWSRRYFEFVRSEPLLPGDFFEHHCFRDAQGRLFDEKSRPLAAFIEPVAPWRLYEQVEAIDAAISLAQRP